VDYATGWTALPWTAAGTTLTPTDATKTVTVPGPTASGADQSQLILGTRVAKGRHFALPGFDTTYFTHNALYTGAAWAQDSAALPSWRMAMDSQGDQVGIARTPAGSTAWQSLLTLDNAGRLLLPRLGDKTILLGTAPGQGSIDANQSLQLDVNHPWSPDTPASASWAIKLDMPGDQITFWRRAPNAAAGTVTSPFVVRGSDGKTVCSLANGSVTGAMLGNGAPLYSAAAANLPFNLNYSTAGAWNVFVTFSLAVRAQGCAVFLLSSAALRWLGSSAACIVYLGWFRDGGILVQTQWSFAGVSGFNYVMLPTIQHYDNNATAGTHTYGLGVYVSNNAGSVQTMADSAGQISGWSFA
jgi:hypothetical protein